MSWYVYAMWVYRVEIPPMRRAKRSGHIDIPFMSEYSLSVTHMQRLAAEFRVPLFEGFTMPSANVDSETASMYKQILLRPTQIERIEEPDDVRSVSAFSKYCEVSATDERHETAWATNAFTKNWLAFDCEQQVLAEEAFNRFLSRYEWESLWNTREVQEALSNMCQEETEADDPKSSPEDDSCDPEYCHDRTKPRCTVKQYVALVGQRVAWNLEGLASARLEKRPRQYQNDAAVHQVYMQATSGGGGVDGEDGEAEGLTTTAPKPAALAHFEPLPWNITSAEDIQNILDFKYRLRLTQFAKDLLQFPCMQPAQAASASIMQHLSAAWRNQYSLAVLPEPELLELANLLSTRMEISHDEGDIDIADPEDHVCSGDAAKTAPECFATQSVYAKPSDYILSLLAKLPPDKKLTRDQTHFMLRFAESCDMAWDDEAKPPSQRQTHHIILLGQGGSGKTHVVQNIVFEAVNYIWPPRSADEPTLMVTASSNEQAKNISTKDVKARTLHNASGMRVQQLINSKMRPGDKQKHLTRLWNEVRVLIVEEVSMVSAAAFNMLDIRSMHARSRNYDVSEATYRKPNHHFGRVPIVIFLGDFLQLSPTANIGLIQDVNAKNEDGSYKYAEPPTLEIQNATRVFKNIPHVFELRGTKRFKPGDPLIELLGCMRAGRRIPEKVWKAFKKTFATDNDGTLDVRHGTPKFQQGFWMAMYWETLSRQIPQRAQRDANALGVPLVFLQAIDECNSIDVDAARRLLNVPNMHNTGHIHGRKS